MQVLTNRREKLGSTCFRMLSNVGGNSLIYPEADLTTAHEHFQ